MITSHCHRCLLSLFKKCQSSRVYLRSYFRDSRISFRKRMLTSLTLMKSEFLKIFENISVSREKKKSLTERA